MDLILYTILLILILKFDIILWCLYLKEKLQNYIEIKKQQKEKELIRLLYLSFQSPLHLMYMKDSKIKKN